nr:TNF receptor-associated factor 3 [Onthophagus taurus]
MNGIRLQKPTCYFCNKVLENETEEGHLTTCGSVLEPCEFKCGAYCQRKMRDKHLKECTNRPQTQTLPRMTKQHKNMQFEHVPIQNVQYQSAFQKNPVQNVPIQNFPVQNISPQNYYPTTSRIDSTPQKTISIDVLKLQTKLGSIEGQLIQTQKNLEALKLRQDKLSAMQTTINPQISSQLENLSYQNHNFVEWRKTMDSDVNNLKYDLVQSDRLKLDLNKKIKMLEDKLSLFNSLMPEINSFKENLMKEQIISNEVIREVKSKLEKLEDFHAHENAAIGGLWDDQRKRLEEIKGDVVGCSKNIEEQKLKYSTVVFDLRAITQIATENAEKVEIQEKELISIRKNLTQLKLDMEILEDTQISRFFTKPGHLIWKMNEFKMKMESAKSTDLVLRSPIFYTHEYGYKIRLIVYLNGIKKWKGRHMIACIHVLKGEYDLMLPWPCLIEGNVTIRDLYDYSDPRHTTKFISAKREHGDEVNDDPQESSTQYIFIPHTTLTKYNHIRDDTLFLEVKIGRYMKHQDETSL